MAALVVTAALPAQTPDKSSSDEAITSSLKKFLAAVTDSSSPTEVAAATRPVADALAGQPEHKAIVELVDALATADDWTAVREKHTGHLLDLYRTHRLGKNPHRLAPLVVTLERLAPERPQVQLGLAEVFGAVWDAQDIARAVKAIGNVRSLMPAKGDGAIEIVGKLAGFIGLAGDAVAGWRGATHLFGYLDQVTASLQGGGGAVRVLTADDLLAFQVLEELLAARRAGDQAALLKALADLRRMQPRNPVYPLLCAETLASFGPAWNEASAKKELKLFFDLTDPKQPVPASNEPWVGWTDVAALLRMLGWRPAIGDAGWNSSKDLRDYAKRLESAIKPKVDERLVISPDKKELQFQIKRLEAAVPDLERKRSKCTQELADLEQARDDAERAWKGAGNDRGRYQDSKSDLHTKFADLVRQVGAKSKEAATAVERHARETARLGVYRKRMAAFEP
ncbi:MAG: hypothetical protein JNK15_18735 [Planctomycetes bacterium]|nr:hypothetical protein [Planctomycetota bacterium]